MNRILTVIAAVVFVSGCSSMQLGGTTTPAERHQAAKTEYYQDLNRGHFSALNEVDAESGRAPVER